MLMPTTGHETEGFIHRIHVLSLPSAHFSSGFTIKILCKYYVCPAPQACPLFHYLDYPV
jgi:hypothetical protein